MLLSFCGSLRSRSGTPGRDDRVSMTLAPKGTRFEPPSLSSESARARLAAGGNGIRTVSPSPVRVGLFAACGKFAAWLDLFMTPWWRERDSNSWSRRLQEPRDPYRLARHCSLRRRGRLRRRRNRRFEAPFLRRRVYPHWCLQREESTSRPGQTLRQDAARRAYSGYNQPIGTAARISQ